MRRGPARCLGGLRARLLHRHGFPARFNGAGCIATMRKAAVGAQSRAWSKLDWKTSHACLFCANAEKIDIGLDDRSRRACDARGRAALRHRYFRDRSRRPSTGRRLAIRQRQMARGEFHSRRPRRVRHVFGDAREDARPAPQRDRSDPVKTYNKTEVATLPALIAKGDFRSYLAVAGVGADVATSSWRS